MLFIDSDHSLGFATWHISVVFPLVGALGLTHVHDIEAVPQRWTLGNGALPYSVPPVAGKEVLVQEYVSRKRSEFDFISARALAESRDYVETTRPFGGGDVSLDTHRGQLHWVDKRLGYERNPSLWRHKKQ